MKRHTKTAPKYLAPRGPAHLLFSLDLGKRKVGVAVFLCNKVTGSKLLGAEVIEVAGDWAPEWTANAVHASMKKLIEFATFLPTLFVCEWPQKYSKGRKFHKDLDDLHAVGHALARKLGAWAETYTPSEWKGNVPKSAHKKRIVRELSPQELKELRDHVAYAQEVSKEDAQKYLDSKESHDLWDAIGIGLFATARTRKGGARV